MIFTLLNKLIGDPNVKEVKKLKPSVEKIKHISEKYRETLADEDFPKKTAEFKERLKKGETLDDILPEAFALVKDASRRLVGKKWQVRGRDFIWDIETPFDVQLIGGIVLHHGKIAEMKTGEGKTLVCTMPLYLNSLEEKGAYLVTVNDYLAHRDAEWMGGLYNFLGVSVGIITYGQSFEQKKNAYNADITYGTNNEFGFDYLRDNMATSLDQVVQRELNYAIIDEVDSILIDEARTPLIISAPAEESTEKYTLYSRLIRQLEENKHYKVDEKLKTSILTEEGVAKMEELLGVDNIYTEAGFTEVHHLEQALKAHSNYKLDVDYVVKDGEVIIVDEFTGRLMPGRRYSHGLHQAIEAKENVEIKRESRTLATITFQNYFRLFKKLAGMTGTAATEAEEFYKIYGLEVITVPTHKPCIREDKPDVIYKNQKGKFMAITETVKELHKRQQPVLIGTISIEKSEILSKLLTLHGIAHKVLNAKHHEKEAEIVALAGQHGAVTIATNMAGRGTDIKLGKGVKEIGGLLIIGSERHESRRIDNQLRGRSGRQGDLGMSQFYVSMEDDLMRLFGSERVQKMMESLGIPDDQKIENKLISRSIESAQKKVEGHNFDIRKHLVEYDNVMNKQREIIYARRRKILESKNIKNDILLLIEKEAEQFVLTHTSDRSKNEWNVEEIVQCVNAIHTDQKEPLKLEKLEEARDQEDLIEIVKLFLWEKYAQREKDVSASFPKGFGEQVMRDVERNVYLRIIDTNWMDHIDSMTQLRQNVGLLGYGQRDPLVEYQSQGFQMFKKLLQTVQESTVNTLFKINIVAQPKEMGEVTVADVQTDLQTNREDIEENINESHGFKEDGQPRKVSVQQQPIKSEKVGRNEPCPCGSGKKYKKCCGLVAVR